jgi:hypothetical protein
MNTHTQTEYFRVLLLAGIYVCVCVTEDNPPALGPRALNIKYKNERERESRQDSLLIGSGVIQLIY